MDSPVRSVLGIHRKSLQPINSFPRPNPKPKPNLIHFSTVSKADLAKEKIKIEREKTEEILKEKETRLERHTREMKKREHELKRLEKEMQTLMIVERSHRPISSSGGLRKYIKALAFDRWMSIAKISICFKN